MWLYLMADGAGIEVESLQRGLIVGNAMVLGLVLGFVGWRLSGGRDLRSCVFCYAAGLVLLFGGALNTNVANFDQVYSYGQMYAPSAVLMVVALWAAVFHRWNTAAQSATTMRTAEGAYICPYEYT